MTSMVQWTVNLLLHVVGVLHSDKLADQYIKLPQRKASCYGRHFCSEFKLKKAEMCYI